MPKLKFVPMPTAHVRDLQRGSIDSNGQVPERKLKGGGPCRHCLEAIKENEEMLILGYRPFPELQPYAETGPIFLHAKECAPYKEVGELPAMFKQAGGLFMIARGYGDDNRIKYSACKVVPISELESNCENLFLDNDVAYLHIRFAQTNCYQFRVERG